MSPTLIPYTPSRLVGMDILQIYFPASCSRSLSFYNVLSFSTIWCCLDEFLLQLKELWMWCMRPNAKWFPVGRCSSELQSLYKNCLLLESGQGVPLAINH